MSKNIFIPSTRKNASGATTQEDVEFVIWKNPKTGEEYKLLNLENDNLAPRKGIIELKPIKVEKRHENNVGFKLLWDKGRECHIGIPVRFDPKTDAAVWQKVTVSNFEQYDLSNKEQRMEWIMIKHSPYYTDPDENGVERNVNYDQNMKARYKAIDREREALIFAKNLTVKKKAEEIALALNQDPIQLEEIGLMCGLDPKGISKERLWMEVFKYAESKPEQFMKIYKSDTRVELATLKRALSVGVVYHSLKDGYTYSGQSLGFTEPDVLTFLKDHPNVMSAIDVVSRKRDSETLENNSIAKNTVTEENAKEVLMQKRIAELEAQLKAQSSSNLSVAADNILEEEDSEFAELLKEAKKLDVKGAHKIKDKEKLRQRIEEKKKLVETN